MALINRETRLCDVISAHPDIVPVINRFGIMLGTGDLTVEAICRDHSLDVDFVLVILNTFINGEYFPERTLRSFSASAIIDYMIKTDGYYTQFQLPNIHRHFSLLMRSSADASNNLTHLYRFYQVIERELLSYIDHDLKVWFPAVVSLERGKATECPEGDEQGAASVEEKLHDLINMFIQHLAGEYDLNLCYAVFTAIVTLEKDLRQNYRIRNRILLPLSRQLVNQSRG